MSYFSSSDVYEGAHCSSNIICWTLSMRGQPLKTLCGDNCRWREQEVQDPTWGESLMHMRKLRKAIGGGGVGMREVAFVRMPFGDVQVLTVTSKMLPWRPPSSGMILAPAEYPKCKLCHQTFESHYPIVSQFWLYCSCLLSESKVVWFSVWWFVFPATLAFLWGSSLCSQ